MIFGLFLVLLGVVFLLANLGLIVLPTTFWSLVWPLALVVVGLYIALGAHRCRHYCKGWAHKHDKDGDGPLQA